MPPSGSVTSMPTVGILADHMFVPAKLDLPGMEKLAPVRKYNITGILCDFVRVFL